MNTKDITKEQLETLVLVRCLEEFITDEHENLSNLSEVIVTAQELGIIGNDTDWDVGLTKKEAIQLYVDTLQAYTAENGYPINAVSGQETFIEEHSPYQLSECSFSHIHKNIFSKSSTNLI